MTLWTTYFEEFHKVLTNVWWLIKGEQILFYRLVLVVIVVFCVCWAPIQVVLVLRAVGLYQTKSSEDYPRIIFLIFGQVLAYFNRYVYCVITNLSVSQLIRDRCMTSASLIASNYHIILIKQYNTVAIQNQCIWRNKSHEIAHSVWKSKKKSHLQHCERNELRIHFE